MRISGVRHDNVFTDAERAVPGKSNVYYIILIWKTKAEQLATIMRRASKVIKPTAVFSTAGALPFADDAKIKTWAKEGVYYCAKAQIVKGMGKNMFVPQGNAAREAAVVVCTNAYESYN